MATKKTDKKDEAFEQELQRRQEAESEPQQGDAVLSEAAEPAEKDLPAAEPPPVPPDASAAITPQAPESRDEQAGGVSPVAPVSSEVVVAVAHPSEPNAAYMAMDQYDEAQIIEEIEGRMSEVLVYRVPGKGEDLSWSGVREAIRLINEQSRRRIRIGEKPPIVSYDEIDGKKRVCVMAYAEDEASGQGYWGSSHQPLKMELRNGTAKDDEFALQKALSKAQRNALKYFIPENVRQGILAVANNDPKKLREITMGRGAPMQDKPPAVSDPEGQQLIADCRELYKELGREFPEFKTKHLPPGKFNADLEAAWSGHESLKTLKGRLEDALAAYKAAA